MFSSLASKLGLTTTTTPLKTPQKLPQNNLPIQTTYTSNAIPIPSDFLTTPPSKPITATPIDFANSPLPEYTGSIALILTNVLSHAECAELLTLAEASVPRAEGSSAWRPALVNIGAGFEAPAPGYRESDRIIWNEQEIVDRLWERCKMAEGVEEILMKVPRCHPSYDRGRWEFRRWNERMRFLKYSPGQYFKPHCDGPYFYTDENGREFQTHYTIQLYLNDSAENDPNSDLVGGATAFLTRKSDGRVDVNPKAGSVLIFQHSGLLHEGARVEKGTKYTMRTDVLYEFIPDTETKDEETEAGREA